MFTTAIASTISAASLHGCDNIAKDIWRAYAAGMLDDADAEAVAAAIEARRRVLRGRAGESGGPTSKPFHGVPTRFPPRREQVSPDRRRSIERRRRLSYSADRNMPLMIADRFTPGEVAVLSIVAIEIREHGLCTRSYAEIAARAGVCRSLARRAIRRAADHGLLSIEERPLPGQKNLPNIVRITDTAWLTCIGATESSPTGFRFRKKGAAGWQTPLPAPAGRGGGHTVPSPSAGDKPCTSVLPAPSRPTGVRRGNGFCER
jgi:hypothetical protein